MSADITAVTTQSSTTDGATALAGIKTALTNVVTDVDLKAPLISPSFTTPSLGVATATSINKLTLTQPATAATLTIANNQTLTVNGSATITNGTHSGTNTGDQTLSDATITTTDITTNDVSTSKHGFAPKAPNDATKFLDGTGAYSVPTTGGVYSVNADETISTYNTMQLPMVGATNITINGWALVTVSQSPQNASITKMGGSTSADFTAQSLLPGSGSQDSYRYDESKIIRIKFKAKLDDTSDRKGFGLCITPANIHTAHTDTTNGEIRFIWNGATLYAQNSNGTATSTDISSGVTGTNWNTYEILFTPATNAKFYVNGTLKATHTTNLPTTGTPGMTYGANANGRTIATTFPVVSIQN